jgi:1-acyl-sn-glycerol-3-phosphate acyltransferase
MTTPVKNIDDSAQSDHCSPAKALASMARPSGWQVLAGCLPTSPVGLLKQTVFRCIFEVYMLGFLPAVLIGLIFIPLVLLNTVVASCLILIFTPLRFLMPTRKLRAAITTLLMFFATGWCVTNNKILFRLLPSIDWDIELPEGLGKKDWYFVIANHQSWVDITVLFYVFTRKIPFLKYFLKQELIWIPFMGIAMYALDMPYMKRYSKATLEKHPELKGKDVETTHRACEKFHDTPVSVVNFLEGTRYTRSKQQHQKSPYQHLLKPKAGGMAFTLSALGEQMKCLLDVTIYYPDGIPTMMDFFCGRMRRVQVRVQKREIPHEAFTCNYENDSAFRARFQDWVARLWAEKDTELSQLATQGKKSC